MKPIYIFDLDGTLALIDHRRHLVDGKEKNWPAFYAACVDDLPNMPVVLALQTLRRGGAECWVWSGRSDEVRTQTYAWLRNYDLLQSPWMLPAPEHFKMRKEGDFTPDEKLKFGWLADLEPPERDRITGVFDDRDKVVKMWREAGVSCFQVAPGEF